jgi:hypothetical protein
MGEFAYFRLIDVNKLKFLSFLSFSEHPWRAALGTAVALPVTATELKGYDPVTGLGSPHW